MSDEVEVFYDNAVLEVLPSTDTDVIEIVEEGPQGPEGAPGPGVDEFIDLLDTPGSYAGEGSKNVSVKADESGLEFTVPPVIPTPSFLALTDTPDTYVGQAGKDVKVKGDESGLEFVPPVATPSFLDLPDTPDTYVDQAGKLASVKSDESGLEFTDISPSYYSEIWTWTTKLTDADTNGQIGLNANTWAVATQLNVNDRTTSNRDMSLALGELFKVGDKVLIQQKTDATRRGLYLISAPGTDQGNWWSFPLTLISSAGAVPGGNADTILTVLVTGGSGAGAVGADPTAEVGLTPINGTADTFMRSDAAPPLDQGISPTWTGDHLFNGDASCQTPTAPANITNKDYVDLLVASRVDDATYGIGWDGDATHAPSRNAVYDKIQSLPTVITTFLGLTDTPDDYAGQASKVVAVKATEDGLEFITVSLSLGKGSVGFALGKTAGISTGKTKGFVVCPYAATITAFNFVVDVGTATVKVWKIATGTAKPTAANSINTSGVSISSGTALRSTSLGDFTTTAVAANDIFAFEITALGGSPTELMFSLELTKT